MEFTKKITCPNCNGRMLYDAKRRKVVCQFCGCTKGIHDHEMTSIYDAQITIDGKVRGTALYDYEGVKSKGLSQTKTIKKVQSVVCPSCGADLSFEEGKIQTTCPYCLNQITHETNHQDDSVGIIPFMIDRDALESSLRFPIADNILIPKDFKKECIASNFKQIYLPIWVIDTEVNAEFEANYGDKPKKLKNSIRANFSKQYTNIPVVASNTYTEALKEQAGKYNVEANIPYDAGFVSGIDIESCNISNINAWMFSKKEMDVIVSNDACQTVVMNTGCEYCSISKINIQYSNHLCKLVYVPLWIFEKEFKGRVYTITFNGQTNEFGGSYPTIYGKPGTPIYYK